MDSTHWASLRLIGPVALLMVLGGCMTIEQDFGNASIERAWAALVTVAESPEYDDWDVAENKVWIDEPDRRIEIYRRTRRVLHAPGAEPRRQDRTWRFEVRLHEVDPPRAYILSRGFGVPAWAYDEGQRFFAQVRDVLDAGVAPALTEEELLDALGLDDASPQG